MRILGACIFLSFLAGKLRDFKLMLLTCHETKKKKNYGACVFWAPVFFKSFLAGKIMFNSCY